MKRHLCTIALAALLISATAVAGAHASIIETLKYTGYLDKVAREQAPTAPDKDPEVSGPAPSESQSAVPFHFVLTVEWPEGRIPGDAEGIAPQVMSIFREAAAGACASIPGGPGPVTVVSLPTDSAIEYFCGPIPDPGELHIAAEVGGGL